MTMSPGVLAREYVVASERPPMLSKIDWRAAPAPFKLYRGCPRVVPAGELSKMLREIYGITRQRWTAPDSFTRVMGLSNTALGTRLTTSLLRPVPSGGALYSAELYLIVGAGQTAPCGVYHYDAAHHLLERISCGYPKNELRTALGAPASSLPALTVVLTSYFWKNAFKYGDFGYRLGCLDTGVLISQVIEVARSHELDATVRYIFVDDVADQLLRIDPRQESVYAVVAVGDSSPGTEVPSMCEAAGAAVAVVPTVPGSWTLDSMELPAKLHDASRLTRRELRRPRTAPASISGALPVSGRSMVLTDEDIDLAAGISSRNSALGNFQPAAISVRELSVMIRSAMRDYCNDLTGESSSVRYTGLFCAVVNVRDLERGIYYYGPAHGTLEQVAAGDIRAELQSTLVLNMFSLFSSAVCFVPVGHYANGLHAYGDRWYRIQNMEAGLIAQRLHLAAAALGLGCRINCGYHTDRLDRLLRLNGSALTSLVQVMVGVQSRPGAGHVYDAVLSAGTVTP